MPHSTTQKARGDKHYPQGSIVDAPTTFARPIGHCRRQVYGVGHDTGARARSMRCRLGLGPKCGNHPCGHCTDTVDRHVVVKTTIQYAIVDVTNRATTIEQQHGPDAEHCHRHHNRKELSQENCYRSVARHLQHSTSARGMKKQRLQEFYKPFDIQKLLQMNLHCGHILLWHAVRFCSAMPIRTASQVPLEIALIKYRNS
jgi:hypothetical protein